MRDGPFKRVLKRVVLVLTAGDLLLRRAFLHLKGEPKYRLTGSCNGCGRCCEAPTMQAGFFVWRFPRVQRLALWWQRAVNGFELREVDKRYRLFVFTCTHYNRETRQCDSYDSRPLMCRDYPKNLRFEAIPELFPECSHAMVLKKADRFRQALEKTALGAAERKALEEKLMLRPPDREGP